MRLILLGGNPFEGLNHYIFNIIYYIYMSPLMTEFDKALIVLSVFLFFNVIWAPCLDF